MADGIVVANELKGEKAKGFGWTEDAAEAKSSPGEFRA